MKLNFMICKFIFLHINELFKLIFQKIFKNLFFHEILMRITLQCYKSVKSDKGV